MEWMSIGHLLDDCAKRFGESPFLIFDGQTLSFEQVKRRVNQTANALNTLGVNRGDQIGRAHV